MGKTKKRAPKKAKQTFHKKYKKHVNHLSKTLGKSKGDVEKMLASKFNDMVKNLTPKRNRTELGFFGSPSLRMKKSHKRPKKCNTCQMNTCKGRDKGKGRDKSKCKTCQMKRGINTTRANRGNTRIFHLTPKALVPDNVPTNMKGVSTTRVCESHNGSPLKCHTIGKRF
jgi:hypothetical protein